MCGCFDINSLNCGACYIGGFNSGLTAGATRYFSTSIGQSIDVGNPVNAGIMPKDGLAQRLTFRVDVSPGVGESIEVTFMLNTGATALTARIDGDLLITAWNNDDNVICLWKDDINFRVVCSAGCACSEISIGCILRM